MRQPVPFGKYLLLDRISVGGMAEVFKAKSYGVEGFEKIIAIKRILPTMGEDRDFIKMFIDEAKIAGQLAHANICQIFELGRIDGSHFIAMEYIWGKDLLQIQNRLRKIKQQMPVPMACFTIAKVLEGLDYAHRKRDPLGRPLEIVHRDCSPQNVLVSYEGEVKVIDFGIAKATSRNSRTMAGVLKGKFGYMSPEQVRGLPLDRRSDIFALGTMLYECLTGERLFQGETDFSTLEKVRNVDVQNPRAINPDIPEAVERIILKALAKDVDDRYQWCSDMLADLQQFLMSQDVVFTAKLLSGWLKDVFTGEIEKERQQLEQYKRVGRDGLIAGVPAAAARLDVVEHLGEAGVADNADATQLGGPSFEDIEAAIAQAANPQIAAPSVSRSAVTTPPPAREDNPDFGEEAPTEIFGDLDQPPEPVAAVPAAGVPARSQPSPTQNPQSRPPKPPPGRPITQAPPMSAGPQAQLPSQRSSTLPPQMVQTPAAHLHPNGNLHAPQPGFVPAGSSPPAGYQAPNYGGYPQQPYHQSGTGPMQAPSGTPSHMPVMNPNDPNAGYAPHQHDQHNQHNSQPQRTMMGMQGPLGAPIANPAANNYGSAYRVTGQQPAYQGPGSGPIPTGPQGYPSQQSMYPQLQGTAANPNMAPYQQEAYPPAHPVDSGPIAAPLSHKKKSSIGRDVAIGVAIAAVVLGGFLAVKFLLLDKDAAEEHAIPSSTATIRLSLPPNISVELFVDDNRVGTVSDGNEVPVTAGNRRVKLVGPNSAKCEATLDLPGGKTTPVECALKPGTPVAPPPAADVKPDTGSAAVPTTAGSGAATTTEVKPPEVKPTPTSDKPAVATTEVKPTPTEVKPTPSDVKPVEKKPVVEVKKPDKMPLEDKPVVTRPPVEKKPVVTTKPPVEKPSKPTEAAAATGNGYLHVFSKPSARVLVDGADTGLTTPVSTRQISLAPGRHKVTFVLGGDKFTYVVNIKAGATEVLSKDLQ